MATRFYRWQKANIWQQVLEQLQADADQQGNLDAWGSLCRWNSDSCTPTRGGWKKGGEVEEKLGRSRGGFSTKIHIRCEGQGKPLTFLLSPGQLMKSIFLEQLMEQAPVKRPGRGLPRIRPQRVVGDKGYTGHRIRSYFTEARYPFYHPTIVTLSRVEVLLAMKSTVNATQSRTRYQSTQTMEPDRYPI